MAKELSSEANLISTSLRNMTAAEDRDGISIMIDVEKRAADGTLLTPAQLMGGIGELLKDKRLEFEMRDGKRHYFLKEEDQPK